MGRRKIRLSDKLSFKPSISLNDANKTDMPMEEFLSLHDKFVQHKALEGLAPRTLAEHKITMVYLKKYLMLDKRSITDRYADIDVFRGYLAYMVLEKKYKPCTVNVRLRSLKCYLKWLDNEKYMDEDYSRKLKLVKVPQDTIKPLSDTDLRKILKVADKSIYSGYRDFTLMVLMLDCGIRVGEAVELRTSDVDLKIGIVNIRAEIDNIPLD